MTLNSNSRDDQFQLAEAMEERGEYREALDEWRKLASESNPDAICQRARLAKQLGYINEAEQAFRAAIQIDRTLSWAYVGLASILMHRADYFEAEQLLQAALTYEKNEITYTMLGATLSAMGRSEDAIESYETALGLNPQYEEAYFNLASIKQTTDPQMSEALLLKALEYDPDYSAAHRELGWLLNSTNPTPQAEYHLRRAIELDGNDTWARIYLGIFSGNAVILLRPVLSLKRPQCWNRTGPTLYGAWQIFTKTKKCGQKQGIFMRRPSQKSRMTLWLR